MLRLPEIDLLTEDVTESSFLAHVDFLQRKPSPAHSISEMKMTIINTNEKMTNYNPVIHHGKWSHCRSITFLIFQGTGSKSFDNYE